MQAYWTQLLARFDALTQRERALIAAAVLGAILLIGNSVFIDLPLARAKGLSKQLLAERGELQVLQVQVDSLQHEMRDPDEENRQRLAVGRNQLQALRTELGQYEKMLVAPQDMHALLEQMLARHANLRLLSLRTLPTQPARAPYLVPDAAAKPLEAEKAEVPALRREVLDVWKHGIELRLQGSYPDLAAYLAELERLPQRLVWGEVRLKADYPKSELHLKMYTYSLDQAWLRL